MKRAILIAIVSLFIGAHAFAWATPYEYYYYNPLDTTYVINPYSYLGPACPTCYLPQPPPKFNAEKQASIPVYNNSGQVEGTIIHGIYQPDAKPTPPRPYGQLVRAYSVIPSTAQRHPNWHIISHE